MSKKKPDCIYCGSKDTNKAGFTKNKKQRFYCRSCKRYSRENPVRTSKSSEKRVPRQKNLPSRGHLILKLRALAQSLGRTPTTMDVAEFSKTGRGESLDTYYDVFGSFSEALKSAKLPSRYNQVFDKEELLNELRVLRKKKKRALLAKDVLVARKKGKVSSIYYFQKLFGSIPKAIAAAGASRPEFTKSEAIQYLKKLHEKLKRIPTGQDIAKNFVPGETPSRKEILKIFGSLTEARRKAGIRK